MQDSIDTKDILAEALLRLTQQKSFEKITIADITHQSGFNRQTFYYHFRDKYELLNWIYERDAHRVFDSKLNFENWHRYIAVLLKHMRKEKVFYMNTIHSDERYFQTFIFRLTKSIFYLAIDRLDPYHQLSESDKNFYSEFFSFGVSGVLVSWAKNDMKETPEKVAQNLKSLAQDSEKLAYERYRESYHKTMEESQNETGN